MRVFVTGSASCLAKVAIPLLAARPEVEAITGIDIKPTHLKHPKLTTHVLDIRDPRLQEHMKGHDAVLHLAFIVKQGSLSASDMRETNVIGGMNVVNAALSNEVRKFINLSSVSVYGSGIDITECSDPCPSSTFVYACHKAELETYVARHLSSAIQLRSHLIIGPNAQPFLIDMLRSRFWVSFNGMNKPRQQVIHEDDV